MVLVLVLVFVLVFSFKDTSLWIRNILRNYFNFASDDGSQDVGNFSLKKKNKLINIKIEINILLNSFSINMNAILWSSYNQK